MSRSDKHPGSDAPRLTRRVSCVSGLRVLGWLLTVVVCGAEEPFDSALVLGPASCTECHAGVGEIWKQTTHHDSFFKMHRRRQARRIAEPLEVFRIKHNSRCVSCHYTAVPGVDEPEVIAGVSCESCHGPARNWNRPHSDPADPDRLKTAEALGLIRPDNLYAIASRCYSCHTVPDQLLVNQGGHPAGSMFELVSWLQGEVRHNIMNSDGRVNEEASPARRRLMYVVGWALDLEYGLRGLAEATEEGEYAAALVSRIERAKQKLLRIQQTTPIDQVSTMLSTVEYLRLAINQRVAMLKAAESVAGLNRHLAAHRDGSNLGALDPLLPRPVDYRGKVHQPTP